MRRHASAPVKLLAILATASLACFALPSVSHFPVYNISHLRPQSQAQNDADAQADPQADAQTDAQNSAEANPPENDLPETVYPQTENSADGASGLPLTVLAGMREPAQPGFPMTEYGDLSANRVHEIAPGPAATVALPATAYAGDRDVAAAGLPETITGAARMPNPAGMPETVYSYAQSRPVNEAQTLAMAANPNGDDVETAPANLPPAEVTVSPYTRYTDAQRVGMNPCELKQPKPSPYTPLTDAQRAAQTTCD
jgi:hypothetical protein